MVQAAAEGALDFREADVLDRSWWRKVWLVKDYLARKNRTEVLRDKLHHKLVILQSPLAITNPTIYEVVEQECNSIRDEINRLYNPWMPEFKPLSPREYIAQMEQRYKEEFGDWNSPEFQSELDALLEYWASGVDEDDE